MGLGLFSAQESETALNAVMNYIEQRNSFFTFEELSELLRCYLEASVKAREVFQENDKLNDRAYRETRFPDFLEFNRNTPDYKWKYVKGPSCQRSDSFSVGRLSDSTFIKDPIASIDAGVDDFPSVEDYQE